jgi:hypothetical protein
VDRGVLVAGQGCGDPLERLGLARARCPDDRDPRPLPERSQELDRLERRVLRTQLQPLGREGGREVVKANAVGQL